jgi:nitrogen fixation protein NifB
MPLHGAEPPAEAMEPSAALLWLDNLAASEKPPLLLEVAGPGEPLATPESTLGFVTEARNRHPELPVSLETNGLGLPSLLNDLLRAGVSGFALLLDAVDVQVGMGLYAWVRPGTRTLPPAAGVEALLADQAESLRLLAARGVETVLHARVVPGVNDIHLQEAARIAAGLGAAGMRLQPCSTEFAEAGEALMEQAKELVERHLPVLPARGRVLEAETSVLDPARPRVAVATTDGVLVNAHLGQTRRFMVYEPVGGEADYKDAREAPMPGDEARWERLADVLGDCGVILAAQAGEAPRKALAQRGIRLVQARGDIKSAVKKVIRAAHGPAPSCDKGEAC